MPFVASCNNENYAGLLLHTRLQLPDCHLVALDRERIRFRVLARNKLVDIGQKFRILHQDRACEVGTEKIIHSHALACAVAAVAQTELYGKHRLVDALDLAALVDKAHQRLRGFPPDVQGSRDLDGYEGIQDCLAWNWQEIPSAFCVC